MRISVLGVDLGKNVCSLVGLDASGAVVLRRRAKRETVIALAAKLSPCIVGMEACCGAHHLGRVLAAYGHDVRLMSPEYVRPYVKAQKNDDRDAEGIAEAVTRPTMRFVELKSQEQLDMQTLPRSRDRLVGERTALINQLRAILLERGIVAPQGKRKLEQFLIDLIDEQGGPGLSPRMIMLVTDACAQWAELDRRIAAFDAEFVRWTRENEDARRLATVPGVGATIASALIAAIGKGETFERGRDLAPYVGSGSSSVHHRRETEASRHQQARQQISSQIADPRRASGIALCRRTRHAARPVGQIAAEPGTPQCRRRGVRQQAGQDCLGGAAPRRKVCRQGHARGGVAVGRSELEGAVRSMRFASGDIEMA
jgi:transposase